MTRTILLITCTLAAFACDIDDDTRPSEAELDLMADDLDDIADHDAQAAAAAVDGLAAPAPDPSAGYYDCPNYAAFCFWYQYQYLGTPLALTGGDFAIPNFGQPVLSMKKIADTRRVKVFSKPNFQGACKVINPEGGAHNEPSLPFPVLSAFRIEPNAAGKC